MSEFNDTFAMCLPICIVCNSYLYSNSYNSNVTIRDWTYNLHEI